MTTETQARLMAAGLERTDSRWRTSPPEEPAAWTWTKRAALALLILAGGWAAAVLASFLPGA